MKSILLLLAVCLCLGCKAPQIITERSFFDSVYVIERPIEILVPGAVVRETVNYDSLLQLLRSGVKAEVINRTFVRYDTSGNLQLKILIDELGNLTAICEIQDQYIQNLQKEIYRFRLESENNTKIIMEKFIPFWIYIIIGVLVPFAFLGGFQIVRTYFRI